MNVPLLVFSDFSFRDHLFRILHHHESVAHPPRFINELRIDSYTSDTSNDVDLCACTIRVVSKLDFLQELQHLKQLFPVIFVYHESINAQELSNVGPNLAASPIVSDLERLTGLQLSDEQRQQYNEHLQSRPEPRPFGLVQGMRQALITGFMPARGAMHDFGDAMDDLDVIFSPQSPWNDEERILNLVLEHSQREEERQREALSKARITLQAGWNDVLKESEPVQEGQPVCVVCLSSRASICLVDCGHQVMCDECVKIMWTRADVNHACPVCKKECTIIARPILSELEPPKKKKKK